MAYPPLSGLQRFMAVVAAGSLNKAADRLHISQPALTKAIRGLEEQLGVELLVRGSRGVALTSYGRAVHLRARLIEAEVLKLQEDVAALRNLSLGKVRIGAPPGPGFHTSTLPAATLKLIAAGRKLSVDIAMGTREQLLPGLRQGEFDFIVAVIEEGEASADLVQQPLFEDRNAIVVRAGHPLLQANARSLTALTAYPWFVMSESRALVGALREGAHAHGVSVTQSIVHSDSSQFVKAAVAASDAIGLLRYQVILKDLRHASLVEYQVNQTEPCVLNVGRHTMGLIHRRESELSAAAIQFMSDIQLSCVEDEELPARV